MFDTPKAVDVLFQRARKGREFRLGNTRLIVGERALHILNLNGKGDIKSEAILSAKHLVSYHVSGQVLTIYTTCSRETFMDQSICPILPFKPEEVGTLIELLGALEQLMGAS